MTIPDYVDALRVVADRFTPSILIAHSVGAASALYFVSHYPNTVQRVVTLGAPSQLEVVLRGFARQFRLSQRTWRGMLRHFAERFDKPVSYFCTSYWANRLPPAALLIHDAHDKVIPFAQGERLAGHWPTASFVRTEHLGHGLNHPDVFDRIDGWLNLTQPIYRVKSS